MENEELGKKLESLRKQKQGYDRNRSICALAIAVVSYYMYQAHTTDSPEWWFWVIMGLVIVVSVCVLIFDTIQVKSINEKLKQAEADFTKLVAQTDAEAPDKDDDSDDDDDSDNSDGSSADGNSAI